MPSQRSLSTYPLNTHYSLGSDELFSSFGVPHRRDKKTAFPPPGLPSPPHIAALTATATTLPSQGANGLNSVLSLPTTEVISGNNINSFTQSSFLDAHGTSSNNGNGHMSSVMSNDNKMEGYEHLSSHNQHSHNNNMSFPLTSSMSDGSKNSNSNPSTSNHIHTHNGIIYLVLNPNPIFTLRTESTVSRHAITKLILLQPTYILSYGIIHITGTLPPMTPSTEHLLSMLLGGIHSMTVHTASIIMYSSKTIKTSTLFDRSTPSTIWIIVSTTATSTRAGTMWKL